MLSITLTFTTGCLSPGNKSKHLHDYSDVSLGHGKHYGKKILDMDTMGGYGWNIHGRGQHRYNVVRWRAIPHDRGHPKCRP